MFPPHTITIVAAQAGFEFFVALCEKRDSQLFSPSLVSFISRPCALSWPSHSFRPHRIYPAHEGPQLSFVTRSSGCIHRYYYAGYERSPQVKSVVGDWLLVEKPCESLKSVSNESLDSRLHGNDMVAICVHRRSSAVLFPLRFERESAGQAPPYMYLPWRIVRGIDYYSGIFGEST
jgi:hypothetical protein